MLDSVAACPEHRKPGAFRDGASSLSLNRGVSAQAAVFDVLMIAGRATLLLLFEAEV